MWCILFFYTVLGSGGDSECWNTLRQRCPRYIPLCITYLVLFTRVVVPDWSGFNYFRGSRLGIQTQKTKLASQKVNKNLKNSGNKELVETTYTRVCKIGIVYRSLEEEKFQQLLNRDPDSMVRCKRLGYSLSGTPYPKKRVYCFRLERVLILWCFLPRGADIASG